MYRALGLISSKKRKRNEGLRENVGEGKPLGMINVEKVLLVTLQTAKKLTHQPPLALQFSTKFPSASKTQTYSEGERELVISRKPSLQALKGI